MTETPNNDQPGFLAEGPAHCSACFRLIRPSQTYHLPVEHQSSIAHSGRELDHA
jgi:hypothetical protein